MTPPAATPPEPAATPAGGRPAAPRGERQFVRYHFFRLDPAWLRLSPERQRQDKQEFASAVRGFSRRLLLRPYSLVGTRGDCDFLLWLVAYDLAVFQQFATLLRQTGLGQHLTAPHSYLSQTKRSVYEIPGETDQDLERLVIDPGERKYLFVYPFIKTRPWYALDAKARQEMMQEHIVVGRRFPGVRLNTTYSFGLDDQEFVVAFEADDPGEFLDLVMALRESKASSYTLRDTPTFTCVAGTLGAVLNSLGGPPVDLPAEEFDANAWARVARVEDVTPGKPLLVFAGSRQVALFRLDDRLYAVDNRCPHARGPLCHGHLSQIAANGHPSIACPWHQSTFDLVTGEAQPGGVTRAPVPVYTVRVEGGEVWIKLQPATQPPA